MTPIEAETGTPLSPDNRYLLFISGMSALEKIFDAVMFIFVPQLELVTFAIW